MTRLPPTSVIISETMNQNLQIIDHFVLFFATSGIAFLKIILDHVMNFNSSCFGYQPSDPNLMM